MSHFTTIKTEIRDLKALSSACAELGLNLQQGIKARGYAGNELDGLYVIQLKGPYDIALNPERSGGYALTCDWWAGHVEQEVGKDYGRLLQLYAVHKAMQEARARGCIVQRKAQANGSIKLVIAGGVA